MFHLEHPERLWFLLTLPVVFGFCLWSLHRRKRLLSQFASTEMLVHMRLDIRPLRARLRLFLFVLAYAAAILSLSGIMLGFEWENVERYGVDIIIAVDLSRSMLAQDVESGTTLSRLERAKREVIDLLHHSNGDRIGLVAFAGSAFLACPLTLDIAALEDFVSELDSNFIPTQGTSIGEALSIAQKAFASSQKNTRALVLITDGEDLAGEAQAAAAEAKKEGIKIFAMGIGNPEGAPIPDTDGGFKQDASGNIILSHLDEAALRQMADTTGGIYVHSQSNDADLDAIYTHGIKKQLNDERLGQQRTRRYHDRFQWLLALSVFCLMLESLIQDHKRRSMQEATRGGV